MSRLALRLASTSFRTPLPSPLSAVSRPAMRSISRSTSSPAIFNAWSIIVQKPEPRKGELARLRHGFLSSPEEIIDEAKNGRMFILVDDEDRENEDDLVIPAQMATPEK